MCNTNKSETKTKKDIDEWVDDEGRFHRKIVIETITNPISMRDAINPNKRIVYPGFHRHGMCFPEFRFQGFQGNQENQFQPKQFFGNMSDKPLIDFKKIIEQGKKFFEASGMKLEDLFKDDKKESKSEESKTSTAEEIVKEVKKDDKPKTEEVKPLKIVYNKENTKKLLDDAGRNLRINAKLALENLKSKPLNQKKEVKCQKKQKKTQMNQKNQKIPMKKK